MCGSDSGRGDARNACYILPRQSWWLTGPGQGRPCPAAQHLREQTRTCCGCTSPPPSLSPSLPRPPTKRIASTVLEHPLPRAITMGGGERIVCSLLGHWTPPTLRYQPARACVISQQPDIVRGATACGQRSLWCQAGQTRPGGGAGKASVDFHCSVETARHGLCLALRVDSPAMHHAGPLGRRS